MKTTPITLIRSRYRQALWTSAVWTAAAGLMLLFAIGIMWHPQDPEQQITMWSQGLVLVALAALLARLRARHSKRSVACNLDAQLMTHNRIEAATELAHRTDALAEAQRNETEAFLSSHRPSPAWLWPTGLALLLALFTAHIITFSIFGYQTSAANAAKLAAKTAAAAKAKTAAEIAKNAKANSEMPKASLHWITPTPESTATAIEEVPLKAEADSGTGLKDVTLVVTVNGETRPDVKLPADVASGVHPLELSMYLDELNVQPFDMVTYYLRADRVVPPGFTPATPWTEVASTLQFLEVRPLRDDTQLAQNPSAPPPPNGNSPANAVASLKIVQIKLIRDTFALTTDTPPRTDPGWPGLTQMAGTAQSALATRTHDAIAEVSGGGAPAEIVNLLSQAEDQMTSAATSLGKTDPDHAQPDQQHALANLTEVEKYYTKVLKDASNAECKKIPDPFEVNQPFKLPPREQTPAGQLEQLARDQAKVADQLASSSPSPTPGASSGANPNASPNSSPKPGSNSGSKPGSSSGSAPGSGSNPNAGSGAGSEPPTLADLNAQQQKLASDINQLANAGTLPVEATPALHDAAAASREAMQQLAANDPKAATEPAARAASNLRDAIAKVDAAGKASTAALLANAQRTLNQSAGNLMGAKPDTSKTVATDAASRTALTEQELRDAANKQQTNGSQEAAQQLANLANAIASSQVKDDLKKLADNGTAATDTERKVTANKLISLAQGAANGQTAIGDRNALAAQAVDALRRDRANLDRADRAGQDALLGLHDDVLNQAQIAVSAGQGGDAKRLNDPPLGPLQMLAPPPPPPENEQHKPFMQMMGSQIDALINMLAKGDDSTRPQVLTTAQAGEAPPAYRTAVADYFESLAHEPAPTPAQP